MGEWSPVLDRGDGVWLGVVDGGGLGVGSRETVSRRVTADSYVPLWPFLEGGLNETLAQVTVSWGELSASGLDSPESLLELVVSSAIDGGRPYWVELSVRWLAGMASIAAFDREFVADSLQRVAESNLIPQPIRHDAQRAIVSMRL
jgi:hypothetical protein